MAITVSGIYCYPVKSCQGTSLQTATIGRMGVLYDRQWMVIDDETGMFVAQRSDNGLGIGVKNMCLIVPVIRPIRGKNKLVLTGPMKLSYDIPLEGIPGPTREVQVWKTRTIGVDQGDPAAQWVTNHLSKERPGSYRLVRMPDDGVRKAKHGGSDVAFADADSALIISEESLADLNSRMDEPLPMDRFRPTIVLSGCEPYAEDLMERIRINGVEFVGKTLCIRCAITTTNQQTAERGKEPLRTLATYRRSPKGVVFGRNFNHANQGMISVGDTCEVLEWS